VGGGLKPPQMTPQPPLMQMEFHEKAIYLYIIGRLQLASKRVLSGSDCLKIDGGWGFAPDPTGGAYSAPPNP